MKIESDPLQVRDSNYVEPVTINMVEISEDFNMAEFEESENHIKLCTQRLVKDLWNFSIGVRLKTQR